MDDAGLPALLDAIKNMHGVAATWRESIPVTETFQGSTVWDGEVQVFDITHAKAKCVYAWSHATESGKRRFYAVLGLGPVIDARTAVRAAIASSEKKAL